MRTIIAAGFLLLLLLGLTAAGCSNNPYPRGESARPVLYRTMADDFKTLDPSISYTTGEAAIIDLIYASYFRYHYLKREPYVLELALGAAEPVRESYVYDAKDATGKMVRKTGESWTFRIKPGLRFQDDPAFPGGKGREIVAADFLYSFRRMADPDISCPILPFFKDKVLGMAGYVAASEQRIKDGKKADYDAPIAGLQVDPEDPKYTFRILLSEPYPQLRYLMAMHFTSPLAREACEKYGEELARHPVGNGPYLMAEYQRKQRVVLKANPNRRAEFYPTEGMPGDREAGLLADAGKPLPLSDTVVFSIVREGVTGWNLFLQGYLDQAAVSQTNFQQVISAGNRLSPEMEKQGVRMGSPDVSANIWYFAFNMSDPVFGGYSEKQRKLRQAVSLAIDSDTFIDLFRQGNGRRAEWLIAPGILGYEEGYKNPYLKFDLARAKRLLAEAGYPGGIDPKTKERLTLVNDNTATTAAERTFVGLLQKQIEALGIKFESRSWRSNVWRDRIEKGQYQFIRYAWYADYPDPENFVFLLYGPNRHPGPNHSGYENKEYDRLFVKMAGMDDGPARNEIIRQMRAVAVEDCPWIPLWHDEVLALRYDWLQNVKAHPIAADTDKYLRVDSAKRAAFQAANNKPNFLPTVLLVGLIAVAALPAGATVRRRLNRRVRRGAP